MISIKKRTNQSLPKQPGFRDIIDLPKWYKCSIECAHDDRKKAKQENPPEYFSIEYACFLAACFRDRKYIDDVFNRGFKIETIKGKTASRQVQVCKDIGLTLCDIGYHEEGIKYLEKAVALVPDNTDNPRIKFDKVLSTWLLCLKLNNKEDWDKRLEYIKAVENKFGRPYVDKTGMSMAWFLVKTYIDKRMFNEAEDILKKVKDEDLKYVGFLWAEFYFAQGNFKTSADAFEKYVLPKDYLIWRSHYDYRKALAYYYSGQTEKCRKQAIKIRNRKRWDRFYNLEELEGVGIKREKFVDEIINSASPYKFYLDTERIKNYIRVAAYVIGCFCFRWLYVIALTIMIVALLLWHWWTSSRL
jgi:tetratricopeptide (TPR) repeat protein